MSIAGAPIAALENEIESLVETSAPVGQRTARCIRKRLKRAMLRAGERVLIRQRDGTGEVSVRAVIRTLLDKELVDDVTISDFALIVPALALEEASFALPLKKGHELVRWPDTTREVVTYIKTEPNALGLDGIDILYRCIGQG